MKIIYLHQYFKFPTENGGTRSFDLAKSFLKRGYDVEIITSTSDLKYKNRKRWIRIINEELTVHYIYLPYGNDFSYFKRSKVFVSFLWFATFKLLSMQVDLVLATSTPLTIGLPALFKKWKDQTPFVFETRDVWPEAVIAIGALKNKFLQKILFKLEELIYKNAEAIVSLSVDMKQSILSRYPQLSTKPIYVIENISEIKRFNVLPKTNIIRDKIGFLPRFTVLYAGTFGRVNGLNYVIEFAEKLRVLDPTIVFLLIGEGVEKQAVISNAAQLNVLNNNVFIFDAVPKSELPQLYYACSMGSSFVLPVKELWANSANKFFDTLAASKPILINHEGWQASVIRNSDIGFVLPPLVTLTDAKNFVNYTMNLEHITQQCSNAFFVANEKYSLEQASKKYDKVFKQIQGRL